MPLSKDFIQLLAVDFLVATPIAYYFINDWLNHFAYHVSIDVWTFLLAFGRMVSITGLAIGNRTYSVAIRNPVESLKED